MRVRNTAAGTPRVWRDGLVHRASIVAAGGGRDIGPQTTLFDTARLYRGSRSYGVSGSRTPTLSGAQRYNLRCAARRFECSQFLHDEGHVVAAVGLLKYVDLLFARSTFALARGSAGRRVRQLGASPFGIAATHLVDSLDQLAERHVTETGEAQPIFRPWV
jgi:hypothetical protein